MSLTTPKYRVLVVDDSEACARTTMWAIEMLGHEAKIAFEGKRAIELAKLYQPDVIFLDIGMPEMNGYEICAAMRKEPLLANTLIVAQTGWSQKAHHERSLIAGFDYHLVKPVDISHLQEALAILGKRDINPQPALENAT